MLGMARSFTEQLHRLQGNTAAEIKAGWDHLALRYGRDFEFQGRVLKAGPMLSILALHFLLQKDEARREILSAAIPEMERLLEQEEDVDGFLRRLDQQNVDNVKAKGSPGEIDTQRKSSARRKEAQ